MTLFVSDLDGTLIDSRLTIPPESAAGINAAIARGDAFAVATARTPATVGEILAPVSGALPGVVMNGAGIYDFEKRAFVRLFPLKKPEAAAARAAGAELVVIRRPRDRGEGLEDILAWFQADKEEAEWK